MSADEPLIELENISVSFETGSGFFNFFSNPDTVHAVDDISLTIPENEIIALVGESGCGKTTLGKTIVGLQRPTSGTVRYRGQDIWAAKDKQGDIGIPFENIRRSLQIIHQDPGSSLNPHKRVGTTLAAPLKIWFPDLGLNDRQARIYSMLERVGMTPPEDYANRYPHQLSGGEQQRVALIRALLMNPDVILADEAVSALDVSLRIDMMDLLMELKDQFNTSFIFISHNLSNARYLTEQTNGKIGIMYLGELVELGPAMEVLEDPNHPYTEVLKWATPDLDLDVELEEPPLREIDIPDPVNPPSGCRFHTRCPLAREACTREKPILTDRNGDGAHLDACFRNEDDHPYWESEPLEDRQQSII